MSRSRTRTPRRETLFPDEPFGASTIPVWLASGELKNAEHLRNPKQKIDTEGLNRMYNEGTIIFQSTHNIPDYHRLNNGGDDYPLVALQNTCFPMMCDTRAKLWYAFDTSQTNFHRFQLRDVHPKEYTTCRFAATNDVVVKLATYCGLLVNAITANDSIFRETRRDPLRCYELVIPRLPDNYDFRFAWSTEHPSIVVDEIIICRFNFEIRFSPEVGGMKRCSLAFAHHDLRKAHWEEAPRVFQNVTPKFTGEFRGDFGFCFHMLHTILDRIRHRSLRGDIRSIREDSLSAASKTDLRWKLVLRSVPLQKIIIPKFSSSTYSEDIPRISRARSPSLVSFGRSARRKGSLRLKRGAP